MNSIPSEYERSPKSDISKACWISLLMNAI
ncbi:hypothetical protein MPTK1_6g09560 [Marchantia polymorpha subsp. ruderalis]|uniref:Uncharacterized protein n=1 Tax=Marchantia polymorpha subsp. ruderalis TaxID=1480154 RepID=A0AAF6BQ97_MARPO|nr:hypothetical protein Mp_6g09560 [Marchantia polymorpha subsp. ruderalis]